MLDTLNSDYPALSQEESRKFYLEVEADYSDIKLMEPHSIERCEGKTNRVIDNRKLK